MLDIYNHTFFLAKRSSRVPLSQFIHITQLEKKTRSQMLARARTTLAQARLIETAHSSSDNRIDDKARPEKNGCVAIVQDASIAHAMLSFNNSDDDNGCQHHKHRERKGGKGGHQRSMHRHHDWKGETPCKRRSRTKYNLQHSHSHHASISNPQHQRHRKRRRLDRERKHDFEPCFEQLRR